MIVSAVLCTTPSRDQACSCRLRLPVERGRGCFSPHALRDSLLYWCTPVLRCWRPPVFFFLPVTLPQVQPCREVLAGEHRLQPRSVPLRHQSIRSHAQGAVGGAPQQFGFICIFVVVVYLHLSFFFTVVFLDFVPQLGRLR